MYFRVDYDLLQKAFCVVSPEEQAYGHGQELANSSSLQESLNQASLQPRLKESSNLHNIETKEEREDVAQAPAIAKLVETEQSKPETPHAKLYRLWFVAYKARFGVRYVPAGARDGKAAKELLASGLTPDEVVATAARAWKNKSGFWCGKLAAMHQLAMHWNEIQQELAAPTPDGRHPGHCQPTAPAIDWAAEARKAEGAK